MIEITIFENQLKMLIHCVGYKIFSGNKTISEVFANMEDLDNLYRNLMAFYSYIS